MSRRRAGRCKLNKLEAIACVGGEDGLTFIAALNNVLELAGMSKSRETRYNNASAGQQSYYATISLIKQINTV